MGSPDWWRRFEYLADRGRYEEFQEDIWCPGVLELTLEPRRTEYVVIALGELPEGNPADLVMDAAQHLLQSGPRRGLVAGRARAWTWLPSSTSSRTTAPSSPAIRGSTSGRATRWWLSRAFIWRGAASIARRRA